MKIREGSYDMKTWHEIERLPDNDMTILQFRNYNTFTYERVRIVPDEKKGEHEMTEDRAKLVMGDAGKGTAEKTYHGWEYGARVREIGECIGTVVDAQDVFVMVNRDDGKKGSGPNGEWRCFSKNLTRLPDEKQKAVERKCGTCSMFPKSGPPHEYSETRGDGHNHKHLCDPKSSEPARAESGHTCKHWTPADPQAVEIIGLQTDVETLREELKRVNAEEEEQHERALQAEDELVTSIAILDHVKKERDKFREQQLRQKRLRNDSELRLAAANERLMKCSIDEVSRLATENDIGDRVDTIKKELTDVRTGLAVAESRVKGLNWRLRVRTEHLRKYARHHESCVHRVRPDKPCTCGFDDTQTGKDSENWDDDANRITCEQLGGRSITIFSDATFERKSTSFIGPSAISDEILDQHDITIPPVNIHFPPKNELGVWDARIRLGGYEACVKVWVVQEEQKDSEPEQDVTVNQTEILRLLRQTADNAFPLGQSGALRDVVKRCAMMLGKDS